MISKNDDARLGNDDGWRVKVRFYGEGMDWMKRSPRLGCLDGHVESYTTVECDTTIDLKALKHVGIDQNRLDSHGTGQACQFAFPHIASRHATEIASADAGDSGRQKGSRFLERA